MTKRAFALQAGTIAAYFAVRQAKTDSKDRVSTIS